MSQEFEVIPRSRSEVSYEVHHQEEGVVFSSNGGFPVSALKGMVRIVDGPDKKKLIAISLHQYYSWLLKKRFVYVIAKDHDSFLAWEKRIQEDIDKRSFSPMQKWLIGFDTGISARTMVKKALPEKYKETRLFGVSYDTEEDIPHDIDDFGRCIRAVDYFCDALGSEISDIKERFLNPDRYEDERWKRILEKWEYLVAIARQAGIHKRHGEIHKYSLDFLADEFRSIVE